jgi:heavy metal sensor kinase
MIVLASMGIFLYERDGNIVLSSMDRTLHSKLQIITGLLHEEHGLIELELSDIIAGEYVIPRSGHYYKVMSGAEVLSASPSLADDDFTFTPPSEGITTNRLGEQTYTSTGPDGEPVRVLQYEHKAFGRAFNITLAESLTNSYRIIDAFKHFLQISIALSIMLLCLTSWWIVRRSLRPLNAFSATIETITHKNLSERIDGENTAKELKNLASSFNALLDRLHRVFEGERKLLADTSHALKTPLSVIKTQCDVTLQRDRSGEDYRDALQTIRSYTQDMARTINNLLSLARLDAGLISSESFSPVSLKDCLDEALGSIEQVARERNIKISTVIDDSLFVMGSHPALSEAFLNLMENGIRYNRSGGSVAVNAVKESGNAVVTIADMGPGICAADLEKIFERFYRADSARETEGTGLGLSIAKSVVAAHGGQITVESEINKGSCFRIVIPTAVSRF